LPYSRSVRSKLPPPLLVLDRHRMRARQSRCNRMKGDKLMGTIHHNAIIVTGDRQVLTRLRKRALALFSTTQVDKSKFRLCPVTPIQTSHTNGYSHFAVFSDGSKLNWATHDSADLAREAFTTELAEASVEYAHVRYGFDCEGIAYVIAPEVTP
jgi:hypothetical protein